MAGMLYFVEYMKERKLAKLTAPLLQSRQQAPSQFLPA